MLKGYLEVTSRALPALLESPAPQGDQPSVDLMTGYCKANNSPIFWTLFSRESTDY
jgi:hypothetical protein